ncbi:MAG: hypothetical protein M4579_004504, partial [Chaenotheca gracillima]
MADPFGIVGVIGLTTQIIQIVVQFGDDWKHAPNDARTFLAELQTLKKVLSETRALLLNPDFGGSFQDQPSILLSQLGPTAPEKTEAKLMLAMGRKELEHLLNELNRRTKGHRLGWERIKGAFFAKHTREAVENLHRQFQTLNSMATLDATILGASTNREVKEVKAAQQEAQKEQQEWHEAETNQAILNWLAPADYGVQQSDILSRRQEGTGKWLLQSERFRRWCKEDRQTLFCQGMPGAGKTMMTSIVVDHLFAEYHKDTSVGIAYAYCNYRRQHEQKPTDLLASLLRQFLQRMPSVPENVKTLYELFKGKPSQLSFDDISKQLQAVISNLSKTFIVLDALDEFQTSDGDRKRFLSEISSIQKKGGVNVFATSRYIPEIKAEFGECISLDIRASIEDVEGYLDGNMQQLPSFVHNHPDLKEQIKCEISQAVDGMFLLAKLHLESLKGKTSPKAVKTALKQLPVGSDAYDHAYKDAMERIEGQIPDYPDLAKQALSWLTFAWRPLTTPELRDAIAVEIDGCDLDEENVPNIEDVVSACAGLVTVDETSSIVRLVHYTTQEYLERTQQHWFPDAERSMGTTCLTYLSFDVFESGFCPTDKEFEARLQLYPLYDYAARYWGDHFRAARTDLETTIPEFLKSQAKVSACGQVLTRDHVGTFNDSDCFLWQCSALHFATKFDLPDLTSALLMDGYPADCKNAEGQTPLSWAAKQGAEAIVRQLVGRADVDVNSKDVLGMTPLSWAAENGHEAVVGLLMERPDLDANSKNLNGSTPLRGAISGMHEEIIRLLVERTDVDVFYKTVNGQTLLSVVAEFGYKTIFESLVERADVEADSKDVKGRTPLWFTVYWGNKAIVELLVKRADVDADSKDSHGRTPL